MADDDKLDPSKVYDYYNSNFNATKYFTDNKVTVGPAEKVSYFVDGSDAYANQNKLFISFQHAPTGKAVFFKAFITAFNETYNSDWTTEPVYGRGDPLYMFKQTQRKITLAFKIPAASTSEAYENLGRLQMLIQFLYPVYKTISNAQTIAQSPMVRLKVMNLLKNTNDVGKSNKNEYGADRLQSEPYQETKGVFANYANIQAWQSHDGLLGAIENITVNHNLEGDDGAFVIGPSAILPKFIDVNLSFAPIHEHPLGWEKVNGDTYKFSPQTSKKDAKLFPYGVDIDDAMDLFGEDTSGMVGGEAAKFAALGTPGQIEDEDDSQTSNEANVANTEAKFAGLLNGFKGKKSADSGFEGYGDSSIWEEGSQFDNYAEDFDFGDERLTVFDMVEVEEFEIGEGNPLSQK